MKTFLAALRTWFGTPRREREPVKASFQNTPLSGTGLDGVPMHALPQMPAAVPGYVAALSEALKRRRTRRHELHSLIVVETTLRFWPESGFDSFSDTVLRGALRQLETFDESATNPDLARLGRRLRRSLANKSAAPLQRVVMDAPAPGPAISSPMSPGMAAALRALQEGDRRALHPAGAPPPAQADQVTLRTG